MKILIDTSMFVALFVENELHHKKVVEKYLEYKNQRVIFFTSYYILDELFTRLLYYGETNIKSYIQILQESITANEITVLEVNEGVFQKSLQSFLKFSEHKLSFTDASTYTLYKDFSIDEIFTLDSDFKKIGANTSF